MIIDMHVHCWSPRYLPPKMRYGFSVHAAHSRLPYRNPDDLFPKASTATDDPDGEYMMADAARAGVDAVVCMMVDHSVAYGEEAEVPTDAVIHHYAMLQERYKDRFYAFTGIDPRRPQAFELFKQSIQEWKLKGLKLYPAAGFYPWDEMCDPYYKTCIEWGIPVTFHTSPVKAPMIPRFTHPIHLGDVQAKYMDLTIIMAHVGHTEWWEEAVAVASGHPHTYLELSQWPKTALKDPEGFIRKLDVMRNRVGAHRILFASDYLGGPKVSGDDCTLVRWTRLFKEIPQRAATIGITFTDDEIRMMMGENAKRVLRL